MNFRATNATSRSSSGLRPTCELSVNTNLSPYISASTVAAAPALIACPDGNAGNGGSGQKDSNRSSMNFGINVFPNPSKLKGKTNIQIVAANAQQINVTVYEANGRQVLSMNHDINEGNNTLDFSPDLLSRGIYIISITHDEGTENIRLSVVE